MTKQKKHVRMNAQNGRQKNVRKKKNESAMYAGRTIQRRNERDKRDKRDK